MFANVVELVQMVGWFVFLSMVLFGLACYLRAR